MFPFTSHITDDWSLSSHALKTRALDETLSGANLADLTIKC